MTIFMVEQATPHQLSNNISVMCDYADEEGQPETESGEEVKEYTSLSLENLFWSLPLSLSLPSCELNRFQHQFFRTVNIPPPDFC